MFCENSSIFVSVCKKIKLVFLFLSYQSWKCRHGQERRRVALAGTPHAYLAGGPPGAVLAAVLARGGGQAAREQRVRLVAVLEGGDSGGAE